MKESALIREYNDLLAKLREIIANGTDADEDRMLDQMDIVWYSMSEEERDYLDGKDSQKVP